MKTSILAVLFLALTGGVVWGQPETTPPAKYKKAKVSFEDFKGLVAEVEEHRAQRLVDLNTFLRMSKEPGVIVLDTRSAFRYERIHVKGAKHLAFTDFTQESLGKLIPDFGTKILIYCNNNFDGNQKDFASKVVSLTSPRVRKAVASQVVNQQKPLTMALNIPTYINLYGYGYSNVYELDELVNVNDTRIQFEGTVVGGGEVPQGQRDKSSGGK
jgi:rhodanese-related sulfurtransferase